MLAGGATDTEDGVLADPAFCWSSNLSGDLGLGREIMTDSLPAGRHTITLTATDANGAAGQDTVVIVVAEQFFLPLLQR